MTKTEDEKIVEAIYKKWRSRIFWAKVFNKKIVFYGASLFLEEFLKKYNIESSAIAGIIDKNETRSGQKICGYTIYTPDKINNLNPDYMIFAIKNKNIRLYQEVSSNMKHLYPKIKLFPNDFLKFEKFYGKLNKNVIHQLNNIISEIAPSKVVYLFQFSFFDKRGEKFFSGGGERYMLDLADIIKNMGYTPILLQSGDRKLDKTWVRKMNNLTIAGVNALGKNYYEIINNLNEPDLAIYSGIIKWKKNIKYKNNLIISHGITWDIPRANADINDLKSITETFDTMVSVDTSTISWFRSTFSHHLAMKKNKFEYVPNYVDTNKYVPINKNRDNIKITFPRRCSEERGVWLFADVVPKLIQKFSNIEIEFVGFIHTKDVEEKISELISKYPKNVSHRVVEQDKMYEVYQNTDISVIPTLYSEGTSLSCLEAMACGNTVIATNVGGLPNLIINNYNGKLINPDEESLYNALTEVIENESLRKYLSQNAVSVANAFSKKDWETRWRNILSRYLV